MHRESWNAHWTRELDPKLEHIHARRNPRFDPRHQIVLQEYRMHLPRQKQITSVEINKLTKKVWSYQQI